MDLSGTQTSPPDAMPSAHLLERAERWLAHRWVPRLINLSVLVLLSYGMAQGTWRLIVPATGTAEPSTGTLENPGDYNLQTLLAANLFGQAAPAVKPAVALEAIPLSSLSLVLTGVMVTPAGSFALISADGGPEAPFTIGQEISANVSLYAVYSDRVLIRRGAAIESLMLKDSTQTLPNGSIVPPKRVARGAEIQRNGRNTFTVDREQLTQQMQTPEFLTQALMVPNAGGGFLVREIQPGSVYEKLGLRVGDVIQNVNGQPVNSVEDVMRLYAQFGSASNVQIGVRRGGRNESLTYNLQ
jgi:general secretion pathway protein C